jgi:hypothetical protein
MGINLQISPDSGFLRVAAVGDFSLSEAKRTFLEVLGAMAERKTERVLLDGRKLTGEPETIERFYYGEFVAEAVASFVSARVGRPLPRFACVLEPPMLDPNRLGETVAVNRGVDAKAFEDPDEAVRWLLRAAPIRDGAS